MSKDAPDWLEPFQARFGAMLRTPLARGSGTLRASKEKYGAAVKSEALPGPRTPADERLAVYNRQYWFRLFGVLQGAFPLTARLLGYWFFNEHAARYLLANPPRCWNIDRVPDAFDGFLSEQLGNQPIRIPGSARRVAPAALREAARIDAAWRRVFFAPSVIPYRPSAEDAARLLGSRLVPSPAVAIFEEHWPLLELRRRVVAESGEAAIPLPAKLPRSQWWALVRKPGGIGQLPLEPREAELFGLLRSHSIEDALARLESTCASMEVSELPAKAQAWLARSVELDFWIGLDAETGRGASVDR
ncbi:MAG TPA: DNA-binding domain-containing protein [Polyangiaceae bacterium]|nr:DNA-binding domain-containing protein [Polyangiaceae bacterium]